MPLWVRVVREPADEEDLEFAPDVVTFEGPELVLLRTREHHKPEVMARFPAGSFGRVLVSESEAQVAGFEL